MIYQGYKSEMIVVGSGCGGGPAAVSVLVLQSRFMVRGLGNGSGGRWLGGGDAKWTSPEHGAAPLARRSGW